MKNTILTLSCILAITACSGVEKPLNYGNDGTDIICFGDSITEGVGAIAGSSYPDVLKHEVSLPVVSLGYSGMTTVQALATINNIKKYNPYMVIIEFGANDFMQRVPLEVTKNNMGILVDEVQKMGAIAVIADIGGNSQMAPYSKIFEQIAKDKKAVFVPTIMEDILNDDNLKSDLLHPNEQGYTLIAYKILTTIRPILKGAKASK